MATEKALRAAATELSEVLGLEPAINAKAKLSILTKEVEEAVGLINPKEGDSADKFTEETLEVINEINPDLFPAEEEEEVKPVKKGITKKAAPVEEPEEEEEEEEVKPVKKVVKKAAPAEEEDEAPEEEEETKPVKKGEGKKATPFASTKETLGTTRMIEVAKVMQSIKGSQSIDALATLADKNFMKAGGKTNVKQSKNIIKVLLSAAIEWSVVAQDKKGNLSNA